LGKQIGKFEWVLSRGGPFVVTGISKAASWGGDSKKSTKSPFPPVGNDYTRAARFGTHEGVISDEDGEALVFFAEGLCSKFIKINGTVGIINQELSGSESDDIDFAIFDKYKNVFKSVLFDLYFNESKIVLFDSRIDNLEELYDLIEIEKGWYQIEKIICEAEDIEKFGAYIKYIFIRLDR
jgi:hypothetical protein